MAFAGLKLQGSVMLSPLACSYCSCGMFTWRAPTPGNTVQFKNRSDSFLYYHLQTAIRLKLHAPLQRMIQQVNFTSVQMTYYPSFPPTLAHSTEKKKKTGLKLFQTISDFPLSLWILSRTKQTKTKTFLELIILSTK